MEDAVKTREPLFSNRALVKLIVPLIIEQFLLMTVGMADTMMVTRAGEAVVSGVSLVDNINNLIIMVFASLGTGGTVVVSQFLGHRDTEQANSAAKQLLHGAFLVATALMAVCLCLRPQILHLIFGQIGQDTMDSALIYFLLTSMAYPFIAIYNAGAALFRAMGNSRVSMTNSIVVNIVNITINAILIFGFHMGAAGAGIGTLVSRMVGAGLIIGKITRPKHPIHIRHIFKPEFHWSMMKTILGIAIPSGVENGMFHLGRLMVLRLIASFDVGVDLAIVGSSVAANAITSSVANMMNVPGSGVGMSMITVVGQTIGAGDYDQARGYIKKLMAVAYTGMGLVCLVVFFGIPTLAPAFNLTPATQALAIRCIRWNAVFTALFWPSGFAMPNALRAAGDAKFTMAVSLIAMWTFRIGGSWILAQFGFGLLGVWLSMFADWIFRTVLFYARLRGEKWMEHRIVKT